MLFPGFNLKSTKNNVPLTHNAIKFSDILKSQMVYQQQRNLKYYVMWLYIGKEDFAILLYRVQRHLWKLNLWNCTLGPWKCWQRQCWKIESILITQTIYHVHILSDGSSFTIFCRRPDIINIYYLKSSCMSNSNTPSVSTTSHCSSIDRSG